MSDSMRTARRVTAAVLASGALATASLVVGASTASAEPVPQGLCVNLGLISVRVGLGPGGPPTCAVGDIKVCLGGISTPGCEPETP